MAPNVRLNGVVSVMSSHLLNCSRIGNVEQYLSVWARDRKIFSLNASTRFVARIPTDQKPQIYHDKSADKYYIGINFQFDPIGQINDVKDMIDDERILIVEEVWKNLSSTLSVLLSRVGFEKVAILANKNNKLSMPVIVIDNDMKNKLRFDLVFSVSSKNKKKA